MGSEGAPGDWAGNSWEELRRRALAGDLSAENQLLTEMRAYLREQLEKSCVTGSHGCPDASDITQDCLLAIWQHWKNVRGQLRAWVATIARNGFRDAVRYLHEPKRDVRQQVPLPLDGDGAVLLPADTSSPSQSLARREEEEQRAKARARLGPDDQEVIRLHYDNDVDWPKVAQQMGRSVPAVQRLYYRALKRWRRQVESES